MDMESTKKGKAARLYIKEVDEPKLDMLCERSKMSITESLTRIVSAGLAALERQNYKVSLPLCFSVCEEEEDSSTTPKTKKK